MRWKLRTFEQALPSENELARMGRELTVSPLIVSLLWKRGLHNTADMNRYLCPGLRHLASPSCIPGLEEAAQALAAALESGKQVAVWGDYDVDGVTSTAMVKEFLRLRGFAALHHIPQRRNEGYGLSLQGLHELREAGADVVLTVDCGITDAENIAVARSLGMDVIVTDHHLPGDTLPEAAAICNPRLSTCGDPGLADLAGVGVAFFLLVRVNRLLSGQPVDMRRFLDLVALGTLADVVPLSGQNRILAKNGLLLIAEAGRPGIAALKEACGFAVNAPPGHRTGDFWPGPAHQCRRTRGQRVRGPGHAAGPGPGQRQAPGQKTGRPEHRTPQRRGTDSGAGPGPSPGAPPTPGTGALRAGLAPGRHRHRGLARGGGLVPPDPDSLR